MTQSENATVQPSGAATASDSSKTWAAMTHLSAFAMFVGIPSMIGPLVMWLIKKDEDAYASFHGKEAINFNLSFLIYAVASTVLLLVLVGFLLLPAVLLTWFVLVIIGTIKASNGEYYRYPFTIRFLN